MKLINEPGLTLLPTDIYEKAREMSEVYKYLYCIENIIRLYLSKHPQFAEFVIPERISKSVQGRKKQEQTNKWISVRGDADVYYMDFGDLASVIISNWDYCKLNFPSQTWLTSKIEDLTKCRNLIAHNSLLDRDSYDLVRVHFNSISRQLGSRGNAISLPEAIDEGLLFVKGIEHSNLWTVSEAGKGVEYIFHYPADIDVAPKKLNVYIEQVGLFFKVEFNNSRVLIHPEFDVGKEFDETREVSWLQEDAIIQIGQYDVDNDGVKELFICIKHYSGQYGEEEGIGINIFKFYPPAFEEHSGRSENWELLKTITVKGSILGEPLAFVKGSSIYIPRNLRGFFIEWTWVKDRFMDTGNW